MALLIIAIFVVTVLLAAFGVGISMALLFKAARHGMSSWRTTRPRTAEAEKPRPAPNILRHA